MKKIFGMRKHRDRDRELDKRYRDELEEYEDDFYEDDYPDDEDFEDDDFSDEDYRDDEDYADDDYRDEEDYPEDEDIADDEEFEKTKAMLRLMCELNEGRRSGETEGYVSADEVRSYFRNKRS